MSLDNLPALPGPTHRRAWSNILTRRRLTEFERALLDPDLVSLRQELVAIDLRIEDLTTRAQEAESKGGWRETKSLMKALASTLAEPEPDLGRVEKLRFEIEQRCDAGLDEFVLWQDIERLVELRRKTSDTERKYEELHKVLIPATQLSIMFDELLGAIEAVVPGRELQLQLLMELRARMNGEARNKKAAVPVVLPEAYLAAAPALEDGSAPASLEVEPDYETISDEPAPGQDQPTP